MATDVQHSFCLSPKPFPTLSAQLDYIPRDPFEITFPPGSRRQRYNVTIVGDAIPENSEFFNADVNSASPTRVFIGSPKQPLIEIRECKSVTMAWMYTSVNARAQGLNSQCNLKYNYTSFIKAGSLCSQSPPAVCVQSTRNTGILWCAACRSPWGGRQKTHLTAEEGLTSLTSY